MNYFLPVSRYFTIPPLLYGLIISPALHEYLHECLYQLVPSRYSQWPLPYGVLLRCYFSIHAHHAPLSRNNSRYGGYANGEANLLREKRKDNLLNFIFHIGGQRFLQQLIYARNQLYGHLHDEETDNNRGYRVEHPPMI